MGNGELASVWGVGCGGVWGVWEVWGVGKSHVTIRHCSSGARVV